MLVLVDIVEVVVPFDPDQVLVRTIPCSFVWVQNCNVLDMETETEMDFSKWISSKTSIVMVIVMVIWTENVRIFDSFSVFLVLIGFFSYFQRRILRLHVVWIGQKHHHCFHMKSLNVFCLFVWVTKVEMVIDLWEMIFASAFHLEEIFALVMEIAFVGKLTFALGKLTFFLAMVTFVFEHLLSVVIEKSSFLEETMMVILISVLKLYLFLEETTMVTWNAFVNLYPFLEVIKMVT